jgi:alpha-1,3-rhamnosyltransferase
MLCQSLVSIAIPSYNHAGFIKQCIESVIAQDYANIELIIIDDGSSDDSVSLINALIPACQQRFTRFEFRSRPNKGLAATLNEALAWAEGEYFAMLSSDDVLFPNKTSKLLASICGEPDVAGVFSGCEYIDNGGHLIGAENHPVAYFAFSEVLAHRHFLQTPTQLLRTRYLREAGGYLEGVYIEDWYMWLKLTEQGRKLKNIPDNLVQYRYHATNSSKQRQHMFEARKQILGYFRHRPGYRHALSVMCIWAAIDFSCISKFRALACLLQALAVNPGCLFNRYFAKGVLRWLTPCVMVRHAAWLKARWPRLFAYLPGAF